MCFEVVIDRHRKLEFGKNREKHIQNNRRAEYAMDMILRPYTRVE
jgi:hypothetical protein